MEEALQTVVTAIQEKFGAELSEFRGLATLLLPASRLLEAAAALRDSYQFDLLMDVTAVDYWPQQTSPRFHVVYQLVSHQNSSRLMLRVPVDGMQSTLPTMEKIYPGANWFEREVFDMFGIQFEGHSDLRRIIMPADWAGHPLRKDYPLGYEEVQFTFNFNEIDVRKPHPKN
jgi:NADH-quinone oxidoreductase subunit C